MGKRVPAMSYAELLLELGEPACLVDAEFRVRYVNTAHEHTHGLPRSQILGKTLWELWPELDSPDSHAGSEYRRCMRERTEALFDAYDERLRCWLHVHVVPVEDDGLALFSRDVTAEKQAEDEHAAQRERMKRAEEQLLHAQKMEAVGRLAGGVAHDFNNVLTVILSAADYLMQSLPAGDASRAEAEEIIRAGERAASLTRQLLAFSRKQPRKVQSIDVNSMLSNLEPLMRRLVGEDVTLEFELDRTVNACHVDPGQLEQVLLNLVINARDAMPSGGKITIETRELDVDEKSLVQHPEAKCGRHLCITVRDTGVGMTKEVQQRVFEPFFTTKPFGKGTGLGLAMVYGIVQQSGGTIALSSDVGQGTTFRVSFPCATPNLGQGPRPSSPRPPTVLELETVLVAEDEPRVRATVAAMLRRAGYEVLEAGDGEEAFGIAEQMAGPIHLLLTDVKMPRLGGAALAQRLTAIRPQTRVLFMSGYAGDEGELPPGAELLSKPFTQEELLERVRVRMTSA